MSRIIRVIIKNSTHRLCLGEVKTPYKRILEDFNKIFVAMIFLICIMYINGTKYDPFPSRLQSVRNPFAIFEDSFKNLFLFL